MTILVILKPNFADYEQTLDASVSQTATASRLPNKNMVIASIAAPNLTKKSIQARLVSSVIQPILAKLWPKRFSVSESAVGTQIKEAQPVKSVSVTPITPNVTRDIAKPLLSTVAPVLFITRNYTRIMSAIENVTSTVRKNITKTRSTTFSSVSSLVKVFTMSKIATSAVSALNFLRSFTKGLLKRTTISSSVVKSSTCRFNTSLSSVTPAFRKNITKVRSTSLNITSTLTYLKVAFLNLFVSITTTATYSRFFTKLFSKVSTIVPRLNKATTYRVTAVETMAGILNKKFQTVKASTFTAIATQTRRLSLHFTLLAQQTMSSTIVKAVKSNYSVSVTTIATRVRQVKKNITSATVTIGRTVKSASRKFISQSVAYANIHVNTVILFVLSAIDNVTAQVNKRVNNIQRSTSTVIAYSQRRANKIARATSTATSAIIKFPKKIWKAITNNVSILVRGRSFELSTISTITARTIRFKVAGWILHLKKYYVSVKRYSTGVTRKEVTTVEEVRSRDGNSDLG